MGRNRFVERETVRLDLSDGDWVEVKKRLSYGEQSQLTGAGLTSMKMGDGKARGDLGLDWPAYNVARIAVWVAEWSFRDKQDKPAKVTPSNIASLDAETADEILAAIDSHVEAMDAEKKSQDWDERDRTNIIICKWMSWSYVDLLSAPGDWRASIIEMITEEAEERGDK